MFGLGPLELTVIFVLALLVLGPQRIPEVAASLGKAIRGFRKATKDLRDQIDIEDEVRRPFEDLHAALRGDHQALPPPVTPSSSVTPGVPGKSSLITAPGEPVVGTTSEPYQGPPGHGVRHPDLAALETEHPDHTPGHAAAHAPGHTAGHAPELGAAGEARLAAPHDGDAPAHVPAAAGTIAPAEHAK